MNLLDLIIAIPGIVLTSLFLIFFKINSQRFSKGINVFIQTMLRFLTALLQIEIWSILFYGKDAWDNDTAPHKWWALLAFVVVFLVVLKPIRKKVYPDEKLRGLFELK